ncbi:MAG: AsmA family protein, partial [Candidatus Acidiferrales bacterium]
MKATKRKFGLKHGLALVVSLAVVAGLALAYLIVSGLADRWARRTIVEQLEKTTGARVELGSFHFLWRTLGARFDGLTLHGREPRIGPPLFHADLLQFDIHVDSFWRRKISLGNVEMDHFSVHVRVDKDGETNIPGPKIAAGAGKVPVQSLFDVKIAHLRLEDGEILWNDARTPLTAAGGRFEFAMDYAGDNGQPVYLGRTEWQDFEIAALRFTPFTSEFSARFVL